MSELIRLGMLSSQLVLSLLLILWIWVGVQKFQKRHETGQIPVEEVSSDVIKFSARVAFKVLLLVGVWTLPTRFGQDLHRAVKPTGEPLVPVGSNQVYQPMVLPKPTATPDRFEQNRVQNEQARERFLDL